MLNDRSEILNALCTISRLRAQEKPAGGMASKGCRNFNLARFMALAFLYTAPATQQSAVYAMQETNAASAGRNIMANPGQEANHTSAPKSASTEAPGQETSPPAKPADRQKEREEKTGEFVAAPIPIHHGNRRSILTGTPKKD